MTNISFVKKYDNQLTRYDVNMAVIGVGGRGCKAIDRLKRNGISIETIAINSDLENLKSIEADKKILIKGTNNLGCGGIVDLGVRLTRTSSENIAQIIKKGKYDIVFIVVGLGGGMGTGGAPVIAEIAAKSGAAVISIATLPFSWEKSARINAIEGLKELVSKSHTLIVLDNDRLTRIAEEIPLIKALEVMDVLICEVVESVHEALTKPSSININLQDFLNFVKRGGLSTILFTDYIGSDPKRAVADAFSNPLIDVDYSRADGALIHISIGPNMSISTALSIVEEIREYISKDAMISFGVRISPTYENRIRIMCVLSGISIPYISNEYLENIRQTKTLNIPILSGMHGHS